MKQFKKTYVIYLLKTSRGYKIGQTSRSEYDRIQEESRKNKGVSYKPLGKPYTIIGTHADVFTYESLVRSSVESLGLYNEKHDYFIGSRWVEDNQVRQAFDNGVKAADMVLSQFKRARKI